MPGARGARGDSGRMVSSSRPERPSVLLFDLGGVLVRTAGLAWLRQRLEAPAGRRPDDDQIRERWLRSPAVRSFELGRTSPEAFAKQFLDEWQLEYDPEAFLLELHDWIKEPYTGVEEFLAGLRPAYHVSCFSNCNELHWSKLSSFLRCFDSAFSSHLLGEIKPDEASFRAVLRGLRTTPQQVWFFDDSRSNVEAAKRLGVEAFLVRGFDDLCLRLRREGLL